MPNRPLMPGSNLYGLSEALWSDIPTDMIFGKRSRDVGIGFFEDFLAFGNTSLYDGWGRLATGSGTTLAMIPSEANHYGIIRSDLDGDGANDEVVYQPGNILDVGPYKFTGTSLCFEAYIRIKGADSMTTNKWSWFIGMASGGASGACVTDLMFTDSGGAVYTTSTSVISGNFVGFQKLYVETTAVDGMYLRSASTKVDGAVNTDLDTLKIGSTGAGVFAIDTWYKLGLRYDHHPRRLGWWVNGVEQASIKQTALDAAAFPDDCFLQPTVACKDVAGSSADLIIDCDWMAVAQLTA